VLREADIDPPVRVARPGLGHGTGRLSRFAVEGNLATEKQPRARAALAIKELWIERYQFLQSFLEKEG
jgi:hypothetical protein